MEDGIVRYVNGQNKEHRDRLIEYLKIWDAPNFEEMVSRHKKIKRNEIVMTKASLHNVVMSGLNTKYILEKLEVDSKSHST